MFKPIWFCIVAMLALVSSVFPQNLATGTLVGTVTDNTGAVVAGAKVSVTNTQTQVVSREVTNGEGSYYVPFLGIGSYEVLVEAAGFKKYEQTGFVINAGE